MKPAALCLFLMLTLVTMLNAKSPPRKTVSQKYDCQQYEELPLKDPPSCPRTFKPICGSDGNTYANKCIFCHAVLKSDGNLHFEHRGSC
ncbi:ovomucoid-like [Sminthopsis crassicaudata]|uniref:ovomucoid-like n=1 Tax=Sminthopsis crassicaudata TaxID=9301 RepID=UPI003D682C29